MKGALRFLRELGRTSNEPASTQPVEEEFFRPTRGLELATYLEAGDIQGIHHLARYLWMAEVLREAAPRTLLDCACGSGYGSFLLAQALPSTTVIGADLDPRAIEVARSAYRRDNLRFVRGDLEAWSAGDDLELSIGSPEAVVSFDTLEHLSHRDVALLRLAENLPAQGVVALSTPCGHAETRLRPEWLPHHIEFSAADLKGLLRRFFAEILAPEDGNLPRATFWSDEVNRGETRYLNVANPLVCRRPIRVDGSGNRRPGGTLFAELGSEGR